MVAKQRLTKKSKKRTGKKRGPKKGEGGRPEVVWSADQWKVFNAMCACGALCADIAEALSLHPDTINAICKREHGLTFSAYRTLKKARGRVSVAAKQLEVADAGNVTMLIWLGKQWLDQRDYKDPPEPLGPLKVQLKLSLVDNNNDADDDEVDEL